MQVNYSITHLGERAKRKDRENAEEREVKGRANVVVTISDIKANSKDFIIKRYGNDAYTSTDAKGK